MLSLSAVGKSFDRPVLQDISLSIKEKEFVAIVGRSGCGKSTLLRIIAGLLSHEGTVERHTQHISIMFQQPNLLPWRTVQHNVGIPLELTGTPGDVLLALKKVQLEHVAENYPNELSGGMQQRVALARALVMSPKLLLLDEPFSSVDEITRVQLQRELKAQHSNAGLTTVLITHSLEEAVSLADRVIVLDGSVCGEFRGVDRESDHFWRTVECIRATLG